MDADEDGAADVVHMWLPGGGHVTPMVAALGTKWLHVRKRERGVLGTWCTPMRRHNTKKLLATRKKGSGAFGSTAK